jgi:hypothetical protein
MTGGAGFDTLEAMYLDKVNRCTEVRVFRTHDEMTHLDGLCIKFQTFLLIREELLNILTLISLELDHLSHLSVDDDSAIAS